MNESAPQILLVNGSRRQMLQNHPDSGAFTEDKIKKITTN